MRNGFLNDAASAGKGHGPFIAATWPANTAQRFARRAHRLGLGAFEQRGVVQDFTCGARDVQGHHIAALNPKSNPSKHDSLLGDAEVCLCGISRFDGVIVG